MITTALIPGRPAPKLIPAAAIARMRPGSVIVDLAAEAGGNAESTVPDEIVERDGVTLVGLTNLASTMPFHASQLYARNVSALLQHLAPEGELALDWDDEITAGACVTREKVAAREPRAPPDLRDHDPRARDLPRLRGDLQGADAVAHAADVRARTRSTASSSSARCSSPVSIDKDTLTSVIGLIAVVLASANVVGGFVVTDRMLEMFKKREKKPEP